MDGGKIFDPGAARLRRARARGKAAAISCVVSSPRSCSSAWRWSGAGFSDILCLGDREDLLAGHFRHLGAAVTLAEPNFADSIVGSRAPFADASFDLVVSPGGLDLVDDLPGALALIRRALRPDGLLLAGFVGASSLPRLRAAMLAADLARGGGVTPRIHPQIDVRAAGDLLARAGLALPVADGERVAVRYAGLPALGRRPARRRRHQHPRRAQPRPA